MKYLKYIPPLMVGIALLAIIFILTLAEGEYLWKVQELNLFLDTGTFFRQQMVVPGGMLTWMGTFFTQLFYIPWLGTSILCAWWALLAWLTARTFRIPWKWYTLLLIPIALLLVSNMFLGYWIYYLATIGSTAAVALVWLYRSITARYGLRSLFVAIAACVAYPLLGIYGLAAILMMAVMAWRLPGYTLLRRTADTVLALLCVAAVPWIYYRNVYYQTPTEDLYTAALPVFHFGEVYSSFYIPFVLLAVCALLAAAFYRPRDMKADVRHWIVWGGLQCVVLAVVVYGTYHYWYKDKNFHKELRMQRAMENNDWNGVIAEENVGDDEPTRAIVMIRNLALARLGRQGDEMYHYRIGSNTPNSPFPVKMTQVAGKSIYYNYGQANFCYRWCLEDGVEYGWRAEYMKYLTRCALVNGEHQTARKYIGLLKHTLSHRKWAEEQEKMVGHDDLLRKDAAYGPVFHMMGYQDQLTSDRAIVEQYLYNELVRIETDDPVLQEQTLIGALWSKDIQTFWPRFLKYIELHPGEHIPVHYQEAAYLYESLEPHFDINRMPIDNVVKQTYANFMAKAQQSQGMTESMMKEVFYPEFGHTFYYEYFLNRDQELY